jgi:hypothetical protein
MKFYKVIICNIIFILLYNCSNSNNYNFAFNTNLVNNYKNKFIYHFNKNKKLTHVVEYNSKNILIAESKYNMSGDVIEDYYYDGKGNIIKQFIHYKYDYINNIKYSYETNSRDGKTEEIIYKYDKFGNNIEIIYFPNDNKLRWQRIYKFENGLKTSEQTIIPKNGVNTLTNYVYENKQIVKEIYFSNGKLYSTTVYQYNKTHLLKEIYYDKDNNIRYQKDFKYIYNDYNEPFKTIGSFKDKSLNYSWETIYYHDKLNHLVKIIVPKDCELHDDHNPIYYYKYNMNLTLSAINYDNHCLVIYNYDNNNSLVTITIYHDDSETCPINENKFDFCYDDIYKDR